MADNSKVIWEYRGYQCRVNNNDTGYRTGYVAIPNGHPLCRKDWMEINDISCHGGLTYSERESDGNWWIGYDCAHAFDLPDLEICCEEYILHHSRFTNRTGSVRSFDYCVKECQSIVDQLINTYGEISPQFQLDGDLFEVT